MLLSRRSMPTLKEAQRTIIEGNSADLPLAPSKDEADRSDEAAHIVFFLARRTRILVGQHPDWLADSLLLALKTRITIEYGEMKTFVAAKLGTLIAPGPLGSATEPGSPPPLGKSKEYEAAPAFHLDLSD